MATTKTIAPEVHACGQVLSLLAMKLNDIGNLAAAASRMDNKTYLSATLEAIEALAFQTGAVADGAAVAAGASGCFEPEEWVFGDKLPLIAEIRGNATDAQRSAQ